MSFGISSGLMVKADDFWLKGPGFDNHPRISFECHDFAPNVTRLTLDRQQRLMVRCKMKKMFGFVKQEKARMRMRSASTICSLAIAKNYTCEIGINHQQDNSFPHASKHAHTLSLSISHTHAFVPTRSHTHVTVLSLTHTCTHYLTLTDSHSHTHSTHFFPTNTHTHMDAGTVWRILLWRIHKWRIDLWRINL